MTYRVENIEAALPEMSWRLGMNSLPCTIEKSSQDRQSTSL